MLGLVFRVRVSAKICIRVNGTRVSGRAKTRAMIRFRFIVKVLL